MLNTFLTTQNQSKIIARQAEQSVPTNATIITFGLTLTLKHYTRPNIVELFHLDQPSLEQLVRDKPNLYLLVDPHNIDTQWRGKLPYRHIKWLKEHKTVSKIGNFPPYALYKIEQANDK